LPDWALALDGVKSFRLDFCEANQVRPLLDGVDVVLHMACTQFPAESNLDPYFDVISNIGGTVKLLELCVDAGVKRFIYMSSGGTVYGIPKTTPIGESHEKSPDCSYGIAKLSVEHYLRLFMKLHGISTCAIRLANPYGRYQNPHSTQGAVAVFVNRVLNGQEIVVWGDGSVRRDFIYVDDFVSALMKLMYAREVAGPLNIGSGRAVSIGELLAIIEREVGRKATVIYKPSRAMDVPVNYLDISAAKEKLGWAPAVVLEEGISRTVAWQRSVNA